MTSKSTDTAVTPRGFWTQKMEEASEFMEKMRKYPIAECGEPMVSLVDAAEGLEVQYSTTKINDQYPRIFFLRQGLIKQFQAVAKEMNEQGWILKVEDGYRSPEMQRGLSHNPRLFDFILKKVMWELEGAIPAPEFMLRRLGALLAIRCRLGTHISGSAIDISVVDRNTGKDIDRGGPYIEISERTPMDSPFITPEERANRYAIMDLFHRHGWQAYPWEFWHFSAGDCYTEFLQNTGKPARYGPMRFEGDKITSILPPQDDELLEPVEFYQKGIAESLERFKNAQ
ncbi:MAG: M15 family metallopeptidase [Chthoniobacterales bacterium]